MHRHLIDTGAADKIKERGCCLGKYRVFLDAAYYCFLEGIFDCKNQDRRFVKKINGDMLVCKTNKQLSCEECGLYKVEKV